MNRDTIEFLGSGGRVLEETPTAYHISLFNGAEMWCPKSDESLTPCLIRDFYWESWITSWFLNELSDDTEIFIDVGANCGYYSALARNAEIRTFAFEPNPEYEELLSNIQGLYVAPFGVSSEVGAETLYIPGSLEGSATMRGGAGLEGYEVRKVAVECTTLDHFFSSLKRGKTLVKVDAEGMEEHVLKGGRSFDSATWMLEYTPGAYSENFLEELQETFSISAIDFSGSEQPVAIEEIRQASDWMMLVLRPLRV